MSDNLDKYKDLRFPIIKNIQPQTLASQLPSYTAEETAKMMKEMFDKFERDFGFKVVLKGNTLPTRVLFPEENKEK